MIKELRLQADILENSICKDEKGYRMNYGKKENWSACDEKCEESLYKIGMFANMNHVSMKALRYYDEQGILKPAHVDHESGYRYYKLSQMADLQQVLGLRAMRFSIDEIKQVLAGGSEQELLQKKKGQLLRELAELTAQLAQVERYLAKETGGVSNHIRVKELPEVTVAYQTHEIEQYSEIIEYMPIMGYEMEKVGCQCAMPEYCFTTYMEPGYKEEHIVIQTCEAVTKLGENTEKLQFRVMECIPEAACIFHKGGYDTLPKSYEQLLNYIEEHGYCISGEIRESYIDGMWNKDDSDDWLTEIQIPVSKKNSFY